MARGTHIKGRATGKVTYTCRACAEQFPTWAAVERHRDSVGHRAFEVLQ